MDENEIRPFQFGLRDAIWATLIAALILGWIVDGGRSLADYNELAKLREQVRHLRAKYNDYGN
jgi:hypothetical protein